jgi:hypothetical protein
MHLAQSKSMGMDKQRRSRRTLWLLAGLTVLATTGCQNLVGDVPSAKPFRGPAQNIPSSNAKAGVQVASGPPTLLTQQLAAFKVTPRPDPFSLQQQENEYEVKENNERIFATTGSFFGSLFVPKPEIVFIENSEPQPFRRLAGVLVGDSVMAIIDMGDGSPMQVIRPGMQIPNSPWRVVSIDQDKAVLRRNGNVKPKEVVVRLQSPSSGGVQPGQGQQGNPGQNPGQNSGGSGFPPGRGKNGGGVGGAIN